MEKDMRMIIDNILRDTKPDTCVTTALEVLSFGSGRVILVAIGKAAWQMAHAAQAYLGDKISEGLIVTKYKHVLGEIPGCRCFEAGHPVLDENSVSATREVLRCTESLSPDDTVLFLVSGGGSSLFEYPLIPFEKLQEITSFLLKSGADIQEMNSIRKKLSAVKGGKFAEHCKPAKVYSIILSDVLGDPLDSIASGPTVPDTSSSGEALAIIDKYGVPIDENTRKIISDSVMCDTSNNESVIIGNVKLLCDSVAEAAEQLGYKPLVLTDQLNCEAGEAGKMLGSIGSFFARSDKCGSTAIIVGGETVVKVKGKGIGGRNQELALSSAINIAGLDNILIFSLGSDGTDGPTDAAGGFVTGSTVGAMRAIGENIEEYLDNNDSYHFLEKSRGLIVTGPTGTNINDVSVVLIKKH